MQIQKTCLEGRSSRAGAGEEAGGPLCADAEEVSEGPLVRIQKKRQGVSIL